MGKDITEFVIDKMLIKECLIFILCVHMFCLHYISLYMCQEPTEKGLLNPWELELQKL